MSTSTLRIVIAIVLIAHGLGHALGLLPLAGIRLSRTHAGASWLLGDALGVDVPRALAGFLWTSALATFVGAGLALLGWLGPRTDWETLALVAAALSLVTILLFWQGLPFLFPNKIGALAMDLAVLASLVWFRWPPELLTS